MKFLHTLRQPKPFAPDLPAGVRYSVPKSPAMNMTRSSTAAATHRRYGTFVVYDAAKGTHPVHRRKRIVFDKIAAMEHPVVLSRDEVRRVDELAQSRYGLAGIVLMENAGRGAAESVDRHYGPQGHALIACGTGNNGGDGLVIARHLHILGWEVQVLIAGNPASMSPDCAANNQVVCAMQLPRFVTLDGSVPNEFRCTERTVILDALLGTGFRGQVRPVMRALIERLNSLPRRALVAVDVPSGVDCDTGKPGVAAIKADLTITFVASKPGLRTTVGASYAGNCEVVGIGVPPRLIEEIRTA